MVVKHIVLFSGEELVVRMNGFLLSDLGDEILTLTDIDGVRWSIPTDSILYMWEVDVDSVD